MDYGKLFGRSIELLRARPFLIALGIIAAISGGNFSSSGGGGSGGGDSVEIPGMEGTFIPENMPDFNAVPIALILAIVCFVFVLVAVFFVLGTIARGALISGVDDIEEGRATSFTVAWGKAWQRIGRLLGIALLPAIPGLLLALITIMTVMTTVGFAALTTESIAQIMGGTTALVVLCSVCILVPVIIILSLLSGLAMRAAVIDDTGVLDSYRRAWEVLSANLGAAIILFALQLAIGILIAVVMFGAAIAAVLCCLLWPLLIVVNGAINAFFSSVWTLAWREWTGRRPSLVADTDALSPVSPGGAPPAP